MPTRTCVGCRQRRPEAELVRCVLAPDGTVRVGRHAPGRGAWLCVPHDDCLALAVQRKGFDRAFRRPVGRDALADLGDELCEPSEASSERTFDRSVRRDDEKG